MIVCADAQHSGSSVYSWLSVCPAQKAFKDLGSKLCYYLGCDEEFLVTFWPFNILKKKSLSQSLPDRGGGGRLHYPPLSARDLTPPPVVKDVMWTRKSGPPMTDLCLTAFASLPRGCAHRDH